jgi:prepilin-type N-terminal cleavage/methylation domain-containing protein
MRASPGERGFTLVEILVAMAILAFGLTAVIGLFTLATATHKRAIDGTTAALVAERAMAEVRGGLTLAFDASSLPRLAAVDPQASPPPDPETRVLTRDGTFDGFPGYAFDVYLTPLEGASPRDAEAYLLEVRVRWKTQGRDRASHFQSVVFRRVAMRDVSGP